MEQLIQALYLLSAIGFIFSLRWMNDPKTARRGVLAGVVAMALAILGTFLTPGIVHWGWIAAAIPATPAATPRRAVDGWLSQRSERMKRTAASR